MMQPGEDYKFDGEKVTEFPMAQDGILTTLGGIANKIKKLDNNKLLLFQTFGKNNSNKK
jgi:hypothetical protein